ncbi:unnamed protein product [Prunus armeniaca]
MTKDPSRIGSLAEAMATRFQFLPQSKRRLQGLTTAEAQLSHPANTCNTGGISQLAKD